MMNHHQSDSGVVPAPRGTSEPGPTWICPTSCCQPTSREGGVLAPAWKRPSLLPPQKDLLEDDGRDSGGTQELSHVAQEMARMTVQELQHLYETIHAVESIPEEDPREVNKCLVKLEQILQEIPISDRLAYNKALQIAPQLVESRSFRLMFLRATLFNPVFAAKRLIHHFEGKLALFGEAKLGKLKLTLEDLEDEDLELLISGGFHFLPKRDVAGRVVIFHDRKNLRFKTVDSVLRAIWYLSMTQAEDENAQKKGIVWIGYNLGATTGATKGMLSIAMKLKSIIFAFPLRIAAYHQCLDGYTAPVSMGWFHKWFGARFCHHFRSHIGSHLEIKYALAAFGIPGDILPWNDNGDLRKDWWIQYLESRKKIETNAKAQQQQDDGCGGGGDDAVAVVESANNNSIKRGCCPLVPNENDVLLGQGNGKQNHPGNIEYKKLIHQRAREYEIADKFRKTIISWDIVRMIQKDRGGRFLEMNSHSGEWNVMVDDSARTKVANAFRTMRHRGPPSFRPPGAGRKQQPPDEVTYTGREKRPRVL